MENFVNSALNKLNSIGNFIYRYRYFIVIVLFIVCIIFELNGSSISAWNSFINTGIEKDNVILGKNRNVRADEWATYTPMMFSQKFDGFKWFSNIIGADSTDVFMIYALPVLNLMQIFRPFQIGFLLFSNSRGLSFFWMGRLIALFLISFEFGMLITNKKKLMAMVYAFMITFSPMVQWWFAINGTVEIILFAELAIILLDKYLVDSNYKNRLIYLFGLVISAGGYLLVLYPAWQIPTAWVFLFVAIWIVLKDIKDVKIRKKDIIAIIVAMIVFILCMAYIFTKSLDTLKIILNTVYPGNRVENGGRTAFPLFKWVMNIFLPYKDVLLKMSTSEEAVMFTLFPLGIIMAIYGLVRNKHKDILTICLLIADAILLAYSIIGFPELLSKITLLSRTTGFRAYFGIGILDMILLIRALSMNEKSINIFLSGILAIVLAGAIAYIAKKEEYQYITKNMFIAMFIMVSYLFFFGFRISSKFSKGLFSVGIIFVLIMAGFTVNPMRVGADDVLNSKILARVREINNKESGIWLVADMPYPIPEYFVMAGVPLINATNTYPHLERWRTFDEEKKYENIYNRYAHIRVYIASTKEEFVNENDKSKRDRFELIGNDVFCMYIMPDEIKK